MIIQTLNYYSVRNTVDIWFYLYLENRTKFIGTNDYSCDIYFVRCGVTQGSILGPFLFLIHISALHYTIKHHKKIKKQVDYDLKSLNYYLITEKICLNVSKT